MAMVQLSLSGLSVHAVWLSTATNDEYFGTIALILVYQNRIWSGVVARSFVSRFVLFSSRTVGIARAAS